MTLQLNIFILSIMAVLTIGNVLQAFWINRLINKLMSRNYYDYAVTQRMDLEKPKKEATLNGVDQDYVPVENLDYLGGVS